MNARRFLVKARGPRDTLELAGPAFELPIDSAYPQPESDLIEQLLSRLDDLERRYAESRESALEPEIDAVKTDLRALQERESRRIAEELSRPPPKLERALKVYDDLLDRLAEVPGVLDRIRSKRAAEADAATSRDHEASSSEDSAAARSDRTKA